MTNKDFPMANDQDLLALNKKGFRGSGSGLNIA